MEGAEVLPQLGDSLPANYKYIDIMNLFRFNTDNAFFLDLICPTQISISSPENDRFSFSVKGNRSRLNECRFSRDTEQKATFDKIVLDDSTNIFNTKSSTNISILDVYNYFPLYRGTIENQSLQCPFHEGKTAQAMVVAHDIGYFITILNYFSSSGGDIPTSVEYIQRKYLASIKSSFYISIAMGSAKHVCTYASEEDRDVLTSSFQKLESQKTNSSATSAGPQTTIGSSSEDKNDPKKPSAPIGSISPNASSSLSSSSNGPSSSGIIPTNSEIPNSSNASLEIDDNNKSTCFPGNSRVMLADGSTVDMKDLKIGSIVYDSANTTSPVMFFSHADGAVDFEFKKILLRDDKMTILVLSGSHLVYVNRTVIPVPADHVTDRDYMWIIAGKETVLRKIAKVDSVRATGLYNPQTVSGKIAVSSRGSLVICSTYTEAIDIKKAHALLGFFRFTRGLQFFNSHVSKWFENGSPFALL